MEIIVKLAAWLMAVLIFAAGTAYGQMSDRDFADGGLWDQRGAVRYTQRP